MASSSSSAPLPLPLPLLHQPHSSRFTSTTRLLLRLPSRPSPLSARSSPSLSEQLRAVSDTLLRDPPSSFTPPIKTRSTWVNPSKPRPSPVSLNRHRRSHISTVPSCRRLSRAISSLPLPSPDDDSDDFASFNAALRDVFPDAPDRATALAVLNYLRPWQHAYRFFRWLQSLHGFEVETIFYNVVMKSLRLGYQYHLVEELAQEMVSQGIQMDNFTYSTVITCAKRRREFDCAVEWFERMYKAGLMPDEVTYSAVLDVYARLGRVGEVLNFFERGRACGWKPDPIALAVVAKAFGEKGDYDGIQFVLKEMRNLGMEPNLPLYGTLIEACGKARKAGVARNLFEEMLHSGLEPNVKILTSLIKIYGKARWNRNALELWERIRANNWPMDLFSYNALLSMCADLGLEKEAEMLFVEMKRSERTRPDSWSYTGMVNIYANAGKVEKAMELFTEMLECGLEPNVMTYTCLMQCFGRARRINVVVKVFDLLIERGIKPDDRLCCCLLSVLGFCEEGDMEKILVCLEKANSRLAKFVKMLSDDQVGLDVVKEEFREVLNGTGIESRRALCNCLIDICLNQNFPSQRARELFRLATMYRLYPRLHTKDSEGFSLNLRSLSFGAAYVAFEEWMRKLAGILKGDEDALPQLFFVHTGSGNHKYSNGLGSTLASHLAEISAPFCWSETVGGCFVATREDLVPWLQARSPALAACT